MSDSCSLKELKNQIVSIQPGGELNFYIENAYCNFPFFLKSLTRHNSSAYTYFGDVQKNLFYISDNMRDDFGFASNLVPDFLTEWRKRIYGAKWKKIYDDDHDRMIASKSEIHDLHYQVQDKDGEIFWVRCCGDMEWNDDHSLPLFFSGRVSKQSDTFVVDPVTTFPINDTLQRCLHDRQKSGESFWTIGFCLNQMSKINTLHSRLFADRLIHDISRDLVDALGNEMTFYRLPGVRCIAVCDKEVDEEKVVGQIREIIESQYKTFGLVVDLPCSFVAMRFPQQDWSVAEFQENMVALIKLARHEKQREFTRYNEENISKIHELANMSMTITENVLNNMENFRAVVQPVVDAETGEIVAGETLMRWKFVGCDISPAVFIPILEKDRMIHIAGRWIFEQAVKTCAQIVKKQPDFYLTVNVSLQQLYDNELIPFIYRVLEQYHLDGRHIVIEMTESCLDNEPGRLQGLIDACRGIGIRLALDDFGTGYSSLRVLMKYPTDIIKIDRSLLLEMEQSEEKRKFIASLISACHGLNRKICVEGVETQQQQNLVKESGGNLIQGFYYYRPVEIEDLFHKIFV